MRPRPHDAIRSQAHFTSFPSLWWRHVALEVDEGSEGLGLCVHRQNGLTACVVARMPVPHTRHTPPRTLPKHAEEVERHRKQQQNAPPRQHAPARSAERYFCSSTESDCIRK